MIELERKAWVDDPKNLLKNLYQEAQFLKHEYKKDLYYVPKSLYTSIELKSGYTFNVLKDKNIFRVRFIDDKEFQINYKSVENLNSETEYNLEHEINLEIKNWNFYKQFFKYLNFFCFIKKIKKTTLFKKEDLLLEYNYIEGLGFFLEVEYLISEEAQSVDLNQKLKDIYKIFNFFKLKNFEKRLYIDLLLEKEWKTQKENLFKENQKLNDEN